MSLHLKYSHSAKIWVFIPQKKIIEKYGFNNKFFIKIIYSNKATRLFNKPVWSKKGGPMFWVKKPFFEFS
jgi:hypothetical protein